MFKFLFSLTLTGLLASATGNVYADNLNQSIQVADNQSTVQITLPANVTTGYQWYVENYDHALLSLQSYQYARGDSQQLGSSGNAVFVFNIDPGFYDAPQITNLTFIYQRPWSPGQNTSTAVISLSTTVEDKTPNVDTEKLPATDPGSMNVTPTVATDKLQSNPGTASNNWLNLPNASPSNS